MKQDNFQTKGFLVPVDAFGFHIDLGTLDDHLNLIENLIRTRDRVFIFNHNLHSIYFYYHDPDVRGLYRNAVVMIDGTSILWLLRLAGVDARHHHRMAWIDFIWPLLARANERGWRVFYLGNTPEVNAAALAKIRQRFPNLAISGHHGYFDAASESTDSGRLVAEINAFGADICIVGMGTPRQERWIVEHRSRINAPVMFSSGACLEYIAGAAGTPPRWMGRWGLEWAYRLFDNPRRFAHRYFVEPWFVLFMLLRHRKRASGKPQ